jgi:cytochrome c oxidase cbb3-type subunit 3
MIETVTYGRPNTSMMRFADVLSADEITAVVDFVRSAFMSGSSANTRYHTEENGWPDHARYGAAFPFALGEVPLDTPFEQLDPAQQAGRRLFMSSCITCHDRGRVTEAGELWNRKSISFPRAAYSHQSEAKSVSASDAFEVDAVSGASPFADHDRPPPAPELTEQQSQGKTLFEKNCAFCHGADGTGKNWIGSFLQPHPRDLTVEQWAQEVTPERLRTVIRDGIPNTTMSAWRTVLTAEQIDTLVEYVMRMFVLPARK